MQLNIFDDSRDVMLRNDVVSALERCDAPAARAALNRFMEEYPSDETLAPLGILSAAVAQRGEALFADHEALRAAEAELSDHVEPTARRMFGAKSGAAWLNGAWRELARRSARLAFREGERELHAAPLWLRGGDWEAADRAATAIASWRRIPAPLAWVIEARHRRQGLEAVWPLLCELAWMSPDCFGRLLGRLADSALTQLRKDFDAGFEAEGTSADLACDLACDLAWFPAWVLADKPRLAPLLRQAMAGQDSAPERGMRLLLQLTGLGKQGRQADIVERRQALQALQPSLYGAYLWKL